MVSCCCCGSSLRPIRISAHAVPTLGVSRKLLLLGFAVKSDLVGWGVGDRYPSFCRLPLPNIEPAPPLKRLRPTSASIFLNSRFVIVALSRAANVCLLSSRAECKIAPPHLFDASKSHGLKGRPRSPRPVRIRPPCSVRRAYIDGSSIPPPRRETSRDYLPNHGLRDRRRCR